MIQAKVERTPPRVLPVSIIVALALSAFIPLAFSSGNMISFAATGSSCPSNEIFNYAIAGGAPNTFNFLNVHSTSAAAIAQLIWLDLIPSTPVNGSGLIWSDSVTDSVTSNNNYTRWYFHVRPDATWSNGQPVTAQDILNTFSTSYALNASYDFQNLAGEISKAVAVNSSTAEFILNQSDANLPFKMGAHVMTAVVSPQWIAQGPNFDGFGVTDVTDGPFYPVNYTAGQTQLVLLRNPYFQPQPKICEIIADFVESTSTAVNLLLSGSADFANNIDNTEVATLLAHSGMHVYLLPGEKDQSISWNIQVYPYNMTQFRQAMVYAINQTSILQTAWGGLGATAYNAEGTVPAAGTLYYDKNQPTYNYDPTEALQLLHSIGFTTDSSGTLHYPNGTAVSLALWATNDQTGNTIAAGIVQTDLQKIGISVALNVVAKGTLIGYSHKNTDNVDHAMLMEAQPTQLPGVPYVLSLPSWDDYTNFAPFPQWMPTGAPENNYMGNLTLLQQTTDPTLLAKYLDNIQQLYAQNLPILILSDPDLVHAYSTADWTNWPSQFVIPEQGEWINTATLPELTPVGLTTSTNTGTVSTTSGSGTGSSIATTSSSPLSTTANSTTNTSGGSSDLLAIAAVVIVLIVVFSAYVFMRRRPKGQTTST